MSICCVAHLALVLRHVLHFHLPPSVSAPVQLQLDFLWPSITGSIQHLYHLVSINCMCGILQAACELLHMFVPSRTPGPLLGRSVLRPPPRTTRTPPAEPPPVPAEHPAEPAEDPHVWLRPRTFRRLFGWVKSGRTPGFLGVPERVPTSDWGGTF